MHRGGARRLNDAVGRAAPCIHAQEMDGQAVRPHVRLAGHGLNPPLLGRRRRAAGRAAGALNCRKGDGIFNALRGELGTRSATICSNVRCVMGVSPSRDARLAIVGGCPSARTTGSSSCSFAAPRSAAPHSTPRHGPAHQASWRAPTIAGEAQTERLERFFRRIRPPWCLPDWPLEQSAIIGHRGTDPCRMRP
jgi:hypothetical protein